MNAREETVRRWFAMWLRGEDLGIRDIFAADAVYTESWGPVYRGAEQIACWFREWLTRGRVLTWDIHRFFHAGDQTAATWFFQYRMGDEEPAGFEGVSVLRWTEDGKIAALTEYGCEPDQYDPYAGGPGPVFAVKGVEDTILALWQAVAEQDERRLAQFFTADARILWPNTGERFDLAGYLRANCDYPGRWSGRVEEIAGDGSCSVSKVWSPEGDAFRAVTFYQWRNGKIAHMTEYWGDIGPAPGWRRGLALL